MGLVRQTANLVLTLAPVLNYSPLLKLSIFHKQFFLEFEMSWFSYQAMLVVFNCLIQIGDLSMTVIQLYFCFFL
jgi:hypothetical protein